MTLMRMAGNPRSVLDLPPPFEAAWRRGDIPAAAEVAAAAGAGPGTLLIADDAALCDLALVLAPDRPSVECRAALPLAMLAMADALTALGPPLKDVAFAWPDRLMVDGAEAGRARLALAPTRAADDVPDWAVVGVRVRLRLPPGADEPGTTPEITALHEEGFGDLEVVDIVESFARHFLHWTHRWMEEGAAPVAAAFERRLGLPAGARVDPLTFDPVEPGLDGRPVPCP